MPAYLRSVVTIETGAELHVAYRHLQERAGDGTGLHVVWDELVSDCLFSLLGQSVDAGDPAEDLGRALYGVALLAGGNAAEVAEYADHELTRHFKKSVPLSSDYDYEVAAELGLMGCEVDGLDVDGAFLGEHPHYEEAASIVIDRHWQRDYEVAGRFVQYLKDLLTLSPEQALELPGRLAARGAAERIEAAAEWAPEVTRRPRISALAEA